MKYFRSIFVTAMLFCMVPQNTLSQVINGDAVQNEIWRPSHVSTPGVDAKGDLNLSIPVMTVPGRNGLDYPIVVSYQSGIRVEQESSWIGLGWSFDPGSISRDVQSLVENGNIHGVDFSDTETLQQDYYRVSWPGRSFSMTRYVHESGLTAPPPGGTQNLGITDAFRSTPWSAVTIEFVAKNPVEFDSLEVTSPASTHRNINGSNVDKEDFAGFILTDENGTQYVFGEPTMGSHELYQEDIQADNDADYFVRAWHLIAILGRDYTGTEPDLSAHYKDGSIIGENEPGSWIKLKYSQPESRYRGTLTGRTVEQQSIYLSEVVTPTHRAVFTLENKNDDESPTVWTSDTGYHKKLTSIKLYSRYDNARNEPIQEVVFSQTEDGHEGVTSAGRMSLNSISIYGLAGAAGGAEQPGYTFTYYDIQGPAPDGEGNEDVFGYYTADFANVNQDTLDARSWSLKSITYPSGSREEIEYEDDKIDPDSRIWTARIQQTPFITSEVSYAYSGSENRQGGVRVSSIERLEGATLKNTHTFAYPATGGRLSGVPAKEFEKFFSSNEFYKPSFRGTAAVFYDSVKRTSTSGGERITYYSTDLMDTVTIAPIKYTEYWNNSARYIVQDNRDINWGVPYRTISTENGNVERSTEHVFGLAQLSIAYTPAVSGYGPVGATWRVGDTPTSVTTTLRPDPADTSKKITTIQEFEYYNETRVPSVITESSLGQPSRRTELTYAYQQYDTLKTANVVNAIVRQSIAEVINEGSEVYDYHASTVNTWKEFGSWHIDDSLYAWRPYQTFAWHDVQPESSVPASPLDASWTDSLWTLINRNVSYDIAGNVLVSENGLGVQQISTFDSEFESSLLSTTTTAGLTSTFDYDETTGNLIRTTDPDSVVLHYLFDDLGRLQGVANTDSIPVQSATYSLSRERNINYQESDPNVVQEVTVRGTSGLYDSFDSANNWIERDLSNTNSTLLVDRGKLIFENDGAGTDWSTDLYYRKADKPMVGKVFLELTVQRVLNDDEANFGIAMGSSNWAVQNGGTGNAVWTTFDNTTNSWAAYSGTHPWDEIVTDLEDDRPYRLMLIANTDSQTTDFYVDGILKLKDHSFRENVNDIQQIAVFNYGRGDSTIWKVDNVLFYSDATVATHYFDSVGQLRQTDLHHGDDYVRNSIEYDPDGRETRAILPYLSGSSGFDNSPLPEANDYYNGTDGPDANGYAFSETIYDSFGQVDSTIGPGTLVDDTQRFGLGYSYELASIQLGGQSVDVAKTTVTDADGNNSETYIDAYGRTVLGRRLLDGNPIDTQYGYDIRDNLVEVTPPNGVDYRTYYNYNTLGQLIGKSTPDADGDGDGDPSNEDNTPGSEDYRYRYDSAGNLRFLRDPNAAERQGAGFIYTTFDDQGRPVHEGIANTGASLSQSPVDDAEWPWFSCSQPPTPNGPEAAQTLCPIDFKNKRRISYDGLRVASYQVELTDPDAIPYIVTADEIQLSYSSLGYPDAIDVFIEGLGVKTIAYEYTVAGDVSRLSFQPGVTDEEFYHWYDYDDLGRLSKVYTSTTDDKSGANLDAEYTYTAASQVESSNYSGNLQVLDYTYSPRGWIKSINDINNIGTDLFALSLGYDLQGELGAANEQDATIKKDGNISWMAWRTEGNTSAGPIVGYTFEYDDLNRLLSADFGRKYSLTSNWSGTSKYDVGVGPTNTLTYDDQGNLQSMHRRNENTSTTSFSYNYVPNSNRLSSTSGDYAVTYGYDYNGNTTTGVLGAGSSARYDYRNLPDSVSALTGTVYRYNADGQRIFKSHDDGYVEFGYQEYYVRGIDGTVLAVYRRQESHFPIELWYWNIVAGSEIIGRAIPD